MWSWIPILFFITNFVLHSETARILAVFPVPSISHQIVFRPLTQELARRGHEVTVVTTDPAFPKGKAPRNLTEIDVHDLSYQEWREKFISTTTGQKGIIVVQLKAFLEVITNLFEKQMMSAEVQRILKDQNKMFDLLFLETCVRPTLGLSYKYKVPVISISSHSGMVRTYDTMGAPTHPLLYPTMMHYKLFNLSIWEKFEEIYNHHMYDTIYDAHEEREHKILQGIFGPEIPPMSKLKANIDMLFLNVHRLWEGNIPTPPSIVYLGGLHQKPHKQLPQDLQQLLDESKHGVIYMSFGTNTKPSTLPAEKIQMFLNVFSHLPYDILWKWDKDELPGQTKNKKIAKWFPQADLLNHPKIKLFITQGGLQSTDEAITAGVPMIGVPMLGDQWFNSDKYQYYKIGIRLDIDTLTEAKLEEAIELIIGNESFKSNVAKLRSLMMDQPQSALERAVWWTEYVLRHSGAKHLRSPAANISWAHYYEIELLGLVFVSLAVMLLCMYVVLRCIVMYVLVTMIKIKKD